MFCRPILFNYLENGVWNRQNGTYLPESNNIPKRTKSPNEYLLLSSCYRPWFLWFSLPILLLVFQVLVKQSFILPLPLPFDLRVGMRIGARGGIGMGIRINLPIRNITKILFIPYFDEGM